MFKTRDIGVSAEDPIFHKNRKLKKIYIRLVLFFQETQLEGF
jgi:hypothetical protein